MKPYQKLAAFASSLIFSSTLFANPFICPDIKKIKAEGLTMTEEKGQNQYTAYNISEYNTSSTWVFLIAPFTGSVPEEILKEANEFLALLNSPGIPKEEQSTTSCIYETGYEGISAAAFKIEYPITHGLSSFAAH